MVKQRLYTSYVESDGRDEKIDVGDTSVIRLRLDDFLLPIEGGISFFYEK
jgi:hypothetical protein|tara:strand:+ start:38 stop:187 length:150 start_codon:yes stop_codon:yes gene_type:complete